MDYIILLLIIISVILNIALLLKRPNSNQAKSEIYLNNIDKKQDKLEASVREEIARNRSEFNSNISSIRDVLSMSAKAQNETIISTLSKLSEGQKNQLDSFSNQLYQLTNMNSEKLDKINGNVEQKLLSIQQENAKKLEEMRQTVDEKLNATLEKRLGDTFNLVSQRLERVYQSLGEMQTLANGVGDLKRIFGNIKTRGTWGEMQLSMILEEIFTKDQYEVNCATRKRSNERVEFAIKLPRKEAENGFIYLPVDSKFPIEDYQRLIDAQELGDAKAAEEAVKQLQERIKASAKDIKEKYLSPPDTTDYAIMFLPTESLYAEVLRIPGLFDKIHRDYKVIITGPTTITAILNSIQLGFRTLAIEKHSEEVWKLLSVVKGEFKKFGELLDKTQKKLQEASNNIESVTSRTRIIDKKLKSVEELQYDDPAFLMLEDETSGE
jgi:DNA recombination protein RmuC